MSEIITNDKALKIVRTMRFAAQRFRDRANQMGEDDVSLGLNEQLFPWLFGDKCILPTLSRIENRGSINGQELMNLVFIWNRPEMHNIYSLYAMIHGGPDLPELGLIMITPT